MKRSELVELHLDIETMAEERARLGEFSADSKAIILLLNTVQALLEHAIESVPESKKK